MRAQPPHPLEPLWKPGTIIWILMVGEAIALALSLGPAVNGDRLVQFGLNSLVIQWIALLTLGALYGFRRPLATRTPQAVAGTALCFLLVATWTTFGLLRLGLDGLVPPPADGWQGLLLHMTCLSMIVGLLALAAFQNHYRSRQLAIQAKQAELEALQARVRPHFLFNALNSGISLVRAQPQQAEQLLMDLADLFRAALGARNAISLDQELELARRYLAIEQIRFGARLKVSWHLPDTLTAASIPPLTLQPLLENAIHHGIEPSAETGLIDIEVLQQADALLIRVSNPLPPSQGRSGHGIGQEGIRARLASFPGATLGTRVDGDRYVAELMFPTESQVTTR